MLSIRKIAETEWYSKHETNGPPPDDLLIQPWVAAVVRWVCGPDPEPAYVPGTLHGEEETP